MNNNKKIFQASPNVFEYILTTLFIIITLIGYFIGLHYFVIVATGLFALLFATEMHYHIIVFDDRFIIRYSNFLGKIMTTDSVFYFKDVKSFEFKL